MTAGITPTTSERTRYEIHSSPKEILSLTRAVVTCGGIMGGSCGGCSVGGYASESMRRTSMALRALAMLRTNGMRPKISRTAKAGVEKRLLGIALAWQCGHSTSLIVITS